MSDFRRSLLIAAFVLGIAVMAQPVRASGLPADPCSLLAAADVSSILGQTYNAPKESVAPRPFLNTVTGTDCNYESAAGGKLWFRVYADPSPSAAKDLFARLEVFYSPPTPVSHLGDEAYFDPSHALHVRKGNVRFYINLSPMDTFSPAVEKELTNLAKHVAGEL